MKQYTEIDELEFKYLAPYLPYKLKAQIEKIKYPFGIQIVELSLKNISQFGNPYMYRLKPILKPLSDVTDAFFDEVGFADEEDFISSTYEGYILYKNAIKMIRDHFDVYGLIPAGLAVDINALTGQELTYNPK